MFIRRKYNRSGNISIQVIQKVNGRNTILKTVGSATTQQEIDKLVNLAKKKLIDFVPNPSYSSAKAMQP